MEQNIQRFLKYVKFYQNKPVIINTNLNCSFMNGVVKNIEVDETSVMIWIIEIPNPELLGQHTPIYLKIKGKMNCELTQGTELKCDIIYWMIECDLTMSFNLLDGTPIDYPNLSINVNLNIPEHLRYHEKANSAIYSMGPLADSLTIDEVRPIMAPPEEGLRQLLEIKGISGVDLCGDYNCDDYG